MLYLVHLIAVDVSDPALQRPHHHGARARHPHHFEVPVGVSNTVQYVTVHYSTMCRVCALQLYVLTLIFI